MDKMNQKMDEALEQRVADLTARNDETGDGKIDAADLKAQLNRIEAQLELQDRQNRSIMKNQRLRMLLSIVLTVIILVVLGLLWQRMNTAYVEVMDACGSVNTLAQTVQDRLQAVDSQTFADVAEDLPEVTEMLKEIDVDSLNKVLEELPGLMQTVSDLQDQVNAIASTLSNLGNLGRLFGR